MRNGSRYGFVILEEDKVVAQDGVRLGITTNNVAEYQGLICGLEKCAALGAEQLIRHPFVGIGYGNNNFQPVLIDSPMGDKPMHLHNTLLMMGVGSGVPGFVFFVWVFIRLGREFFSRANRSHRTDVETLKLCLGIVMVGFFCRNLFDYMFAGSLAYLFWILMM